MKNLLGKSSTEKLLAVLRELEDLIENLVSDHGW